jgi:hypothetical protein
MGKPRKNRHLCPICKTEVQNLRSTYCSNTCQMEARYQAYIERWLAGKEEGNRGGCCVSSAVRRYLFRKYNDACQRCGWSVIHPVTGKVPLTINHKDGNWRNSGPDNVELLCPNCHSLTPNFGSLNRGGGCNRKRGVRKPLGP